MKTNTSNLPQAVQDRLVELRTKILFAEDNLKFWKQLEIAWKQQQEKLINQIMDEDESQIDLFQDKD